MRIIQAIFILRHALGWRILLRFGVSKFQEIPGTSRYVADAREFHVRRISRSALCACIRADASRQAFRGAIRISCARVLITNSRVLRGERSYAEKKKKKILSPASIHFTDRRAIMFAFQDRYDKINQWYRFEFVPQIPVFPANQARHPTRQITRILRFSCGIGCLRCAMWDIIGKNAHRTCALFIISCAHCTFKRRSSYEERDGEGKIARKKRYLHCT